MTAIIYWSIRILAYAGLIYFIYAALKAKEPKTRIRKIVLAVFFALIAYVFTYAVQLAYVLE